MQLEIKPFLSCKVLIVDDEAVSRLLLSSILDPYVDCITASSGAEAIDVCKSTDPDLILLDMNMPDMDGLSVCRILKADENTANIPVMFVTSTIDVEIENDCWEVGACDFVMKPVTASTLVHRIKNHLQSKLRTELLERMTFHDQLTGLYNRLYLSNEIPLLIKQVARDSGAIGVIMLDIDYFKLFNDHYGHVEGDKCLQQVAQAIAENVKRPKDAAIRYGGEEFMVVLPYTDNVGVEKVAQDIQVSLAKKNIEHYAGVNSKVTLSAGYAVMEAAAIRESGIVKLIEAADTQLFKSKENGRNQVNG